VIIYIVKSSVLLAKLAIRDVVLMRPCALRLYTFLCSDGKQIKENPSIDPLRVVSVCLSSCGPYNMYY
jgi:hypothetical protein